ncbi:MAG: hypothetical protein U5J83_01460 [Bryobacterales bacterium]|nr:hypothetical protein [Bryobacterales bacterium]
MAELEKSYPHDEEAIPDAPHEVLLVLDRHHQEQKWVVTRPETRLQQTAGGHGDPSFSEARWHGRRRRFEVDASARELNLPIRYIGVG